MSDKRDAAEPVDKPASPDGGDKDDKKCIICCRESRVFSIGECDHPVCFECSTRMRVLCGKNECPICRKDLKKVVFTRKLVPFDKEFRNKRFYVFEKEFGIGFEDERIWTSFDRLLQYRCPICDAGRRRAVFNNFYQLRRHVQKDHERFFCDLCVEHLKIFNHERKCYTREELTDHRRRGDADDSSHRGHPLCKFCDQRFIDNDELYRHVRRDHFFCHFCDSDEAANSTGKNIVFSDYGYLKDHFLKEHYLCEEGRCKDERFVNAFRTEIDLKAHKMKEHMSHASKATAKQTRTLELEFSVARSSGGIRDTGGGRGRGGDRGTDRGNGRDGGPGGGGGGRRRGGPRNVEAEESRFRDDFDALGGSSGQPPAPPERDEYVNLENTADFPSLSAGASGTADPASGGPTQAALSGAGRRQGPESTYVGRAAKNMMREEDFPSLSSTVPKSAPGTNSVNITISRQGGAQKSGRPSGVSVEYSRSVTVPLAAPASYSVAKTAPQARVTRISSTQNIRMESPVGVSPVVVSQAGAPTLESIGQRIGGWGGAARGNGGGGGGRGGSKGATISNGKEAFPTLGPPEKILPSHKFGAKAQVKSNGSVWGKNSEEVKKPPASQDVSNHHADEPRRGAVVLSKSKPNALGPVRPHKPPDADSSSDFPSLPMVKQAVPSGARRLPPPPGLDWRKNAGKAASKATTAASAPSPTELTFTNSSGQRFTLNTWEYHKPRDFDKRSEDLTKKIRIDALGCDMDQFNDFATVSASYLAGTISARSYYNKCTFYFGDQFAKIFSEFLALLPNIGKQGELLEAHQEVEDRRLSVEEDFFNCPVCRQVLLARDYEDHADYHGEEENFPKLG